MFFFKKKFFLGFVHLSVYTLFSYLHTGLLLLYVCTVVAAFRAKVIETYSIIRDIDAGYLKLKSTDGRARPAATGFPGGAFKKTLYAAF